ncbi:MAG: Sir2 family NAD-dependent protein deacetylase, partial [Bacteroidales bacterium]
TGAGVSADSGIATFRDSDGLWANYKIEEVCTPDALATDRAKVIDFYNMRRKELYKAKPNAGHLALVQLENYFDVEVVTQNIDDLHERAGSTKVTHLHGELRKLRSSLHPEALVDLEGWEQNPKERHPDGSLLRPFVVFFGENVPMLDKAIDIVSSSDIFIVVGTSLAVYPAASLIQYIRPDVPVYLVDPAEPNISTRSNKVYHIKQKSAEGLPLLVTKIIETYAKK